MVPEHLEDADRLVEPLQPQPPALVEAEALAEGEVVHADDDEDGLGLGPWHRRAASWTAAPKRSSPSATGSPAAIPTRTRQGPASPPVSGSASRRWICDRRSRSRPATERTRPSTRRRCASTSEPPFACSASRTTWSWFRSSAMARASPSRCVSLVESSMSVKRIVLKAVSTYGSPGRWLAMPPMNRNKASGSTSITWYGIMPCDAPWTASTASRDRTCARQKACWRSWSNQ